MSNTIYFVGDSTVADYFDNENYYALSGYAQQFCRYIKGLNIVNLAINGTSSRSFLTKDNYKKLISSISAGDFLVVGFGHNDEKITEERYTDANGGLTDNTSTAYYLYNYYVKPARERGATVILATPVVRRTSDGVWRDGNMHVTEDKEGFKGGDYPQAIRLLAESTNTPLIDMLIITKAYYTAIGFEKSALLHRWKTPDADTVDNSHYNVYGASVVACLAARELSAMDTGIEKYIVADLELPAFESTIVINEKSGEGNGLRNYTEN